RRGGFPPARSGAEHSLALLAPLRCSLAPSPALRGWGKPPFPHAPRRGRGATDDSGVVGFPAGAVGRGTLACAPRFAAVLARALAGTARVGEASLPPRPQRWTRCDLL